MIPRIVAWIHSALAGWIAVCLAISVSLLGMLAYRAAREWQNSATSVAERQTQQGADLLAVALRRDMQGVQALVLSSQDWNDAMAAGPAAASHMLAIRFARFPYPELFFWWTQRAPTDSGSFFSRSDRAPAWLQTSENADNFPVVVGASPVVARRIVERITQDATRGRAFSIFDIQIGADVYQVITRLRYGDALNQHLRVISGFMVNLEWVRQHYFGEIARQVATLGGADSALAFTVARRGGERDHPQAPGHGGTPTGRRQLRMAFFDPIVTAVDPPSDLALEEWTITAVALDDRTVRAATAGARRTLIVAPLASLAFALGLAMSVRAARAHARLAQLRADFVSTVTHELKTPVATIRAAGDTLVDGRVTSHGGSREYAAIVVEEAKNLTRLLDNLLAYSRITDTKEAYSFKPIIVRTVVEAILRNSQTRLDAEGFVVCVTVPDELPPVRADRTALTLALENLVDNAIRYSQDRHWLNIAVCATHDAVRLDVADRGMGIPPEEIEHVTRRFFRGSGAGSGGSGLGLAIAERIIADHGGSLVVQSSLGVGTTVSVTLPVAQEHSHEETHPRGRRQLATLKSAE